MLFGLMVIFCFFLLGFEKIVPLHGPPKFKCIICGSKSGSKLENVRRHVASASHKLRLAQMNELAQSSSYQKWTGMNITIEHLPSDENVIVDDDIFSPMLVDIPQAIQPDIFLSSNDFHAFTNGYADSSSGVGSDIDMPLEELFDMISGEIGENCMITGAQTGLNQRDSTKSCVISDWYPFPNKEVCGGLGFFNITFQLLVFLLCNLHFEYMWLIIVVPS